MFSRRFRILTLLGFPIYLDLSWFVLALLITWSLRAVFAEALPELTTGSHWLMGAAGAIGLFISILLHELGHCVVARRNGMRIRGITLFIFGGVAELEDEPPSAMVEFLVAIAGPIVSVAISVLCAALWFAGNAIASEQAAVQGGTAVVGYLAFINGLLVAFNMLPAFPLDGGRVLRSLLWHSRGDLRWATRLTSQVGAAFGVGFIGLSIVWLFYGDFIGAIWWFVIGLYLRNAAQMSYQQLLIRRSLEGEPVRRFMKRDPVTVTPDRTLQEFVDDYVYRHYYKLYPVTEGTDLRGCVTVASVREVPREQWSQVRVADITIPCSDDNVIHVDDDAMHALSRMNRSGASRLMVVDDQQRLAGVITLKDLMRFLSVKVDME